MHCIDWTAVLVCRQSHSSITCHLRRVTAWQSVNSMGDDSFLHAVLYTSAGSNKFGVCWLSAWWSLAQASQPCRIIPAMVATLFGSPVTGS